MPQELATKTSKRNHIGNDPDFEKLKNDNYLFSNYVEKDEVT